MLLKLKMVPNEINYETSTYMIDLVVIDAFAASMLHGHGNIEMDTTRGHMANS